MDYFLAEPSLLGVIDSYGIELIHPIREGRRETQIGKKGKSNHRWIVGGKLCYRLNHLGLIVSWDCSTANVYDGSQFQHLVDDVAETTVVFSDASFKKTDWHPTNLRLCQRGEWNVLMLVETVFSMLTYICDFKRARHKVWQYFKSKLGFTMAVFNRFATDAQIAKFAGLTWKRKQSGEFEAQETRMMKAANTHRITHPVNIVKSKYQSLGKNFLRR